MKTYKLIIGGQRYEAKIVEYTSSQARININGTDYLVQIEDDMLPKAPVLPQQEQAVPLAPAFSSDFASGSGELRAPLPPRAHPLNCVTASIMALPSLPGSFPA